MFKLAQNIYKPMSAHTPKVTNPFAGAKSASPKIHTFATPGNAEANSYFSNLWNDVKSVGEGIGNAASKVGDTFSRAAQGWNTLLSPYKGTPAQKMEWAGKAAKNVATDFVPGMFQGAINLPANMAKGISDIGTGVVNSVTGGKFFNTAKQNVDNFTSKLTNPFKVDFKGNRTGVNAESFGVGELAGEVAATVGVGAVANGVKNLVAKRVTRLAGDMKKEVVATPKPKRDPDFDNALTELTFKRAGLADIKKLDDVNFNGRAKSPLSGFYGTPHESKYSAYLEQDNGWVTGRFIDPRRTSIEDNKYLGIKEVRESPQKGYVTRFKLNPEYISKIKKADYTSEPYSMKLPRMKEYLKNDISGIANWDPKFTMERGRDIPLDEIVVFDKKAIDPKSFETNLVHKLPDGRLARTKDWIDRGEYVAPALLSPLLLKGQNNTNSQFGNNPSKPFPLTPIPKF